MAARVDAPADAQSPGPAGSGRPLAAVLRSKADRIALALGLAAVLSGLAAVAVDQTHPANAPIIRVAQLPVDPGAPSLVDLNTATAAELQTLPGIGEKRAEAIMRAREQQPFRSLRELHQRGLLRLEHAAALQAAATVYRDAAIE